MTGLTDEEFCIRFIEDVFHSAIIDMEKYGWKMIGDGFKNNEKYMILSFSDVVAILGAVYDLAKVEVEGDYQDGEM